MHPTPTHDLMFGEAPFRERGPGLPPVASDMRLDGLRLLKSVDIELGKEPIQLPRFGITGAHKTVLINHTSHVIRYGGYAPHSGLSVIGCAAAIGPHGHFQVINTGEPSTLQAYAITPGKMTIEVYAADGSRYVG